MIFWHVGATVFLFRWIFRDPKVDMRFLVAGALLPDLVDLPLGTVVFSDHYSTGELWMHTLLAPSTLVVVILLATRRGRRRRAWMALAVGVFFHLLLDGMWASAETFLWPFFGFDFPTGPQPYWSGVWDRAVADPLRWVLEGFGLIYLIGLWRRTSLSTSAGRSRFWSDGSVMEVS